MTTKTPANEETAELDFSALNTDPVEIAVKPKVPAPIIAFVDRLAKDSEKNPRKWFGRDLKTITVKDKVVTDARKYARSAGLSFKVSNDHDKPAQWLVCRVDPIVRRTRQLQTDTDPAQS